MSTRGTVQQIGRTCTDELQARTVESLDKHGDLKDAKAYYPPPLYVLPDDVLVQIMEELYLHDFPFCGSDDHNIGLSSPITITHVSRRLRNVALSLRSIWKCVHVIRYRPTRTNTNIPRLYIERSSPLTLSIMFNDTVLCPEFRDADEYDSYMAACLHLLREQASRWRYCAFLYQSRTTRNVLVDFFASLDPACRSNITFLCLYSATEPYSSGLRPPPSDPEFLRYFPALTHLHSSNSAISSAVLTNITELSLHHHGIPSNALSILADSAPALTSLVLANIHDRNAAYAPATFPALSFLLLSRLDLGAILPAITAPRLHTLVCDLPTLLPTLRRAKTSPPQFPQLHTFRLISSFSSFLVEFLDKIPTVKSFDWAYRWHDHLDILNEPGEGGTVLLPNLTSLTISDPELSRTGRVYQALVTLLKTRKEWGLPLQKVILCTTSVSQWQSSPPSDLEEIRAFGVSIEFVYRPEIAKAFGHTDHKHFFNREYVLRSPLA